MGHFIESLESRTFLSAAPSLGGLAAEGKDLVAQTKHLKQLGKADFKLIQAALKSAGELKSSAALLKTLSIEGNAGQTVLSKGVSGTVSLITKDVKKLQAAAKLLKKKPTSATLAAKVMAAANTLQTDSANRLAIINNDLTAQHDTNGANIKAIEDANPSNSGLVNLLATVITPATNSVRDAIAQDATTALTTDVNAVIAAFTA